MHNDRNGPIYLRRIDTTRNMARFYSLTIQPTLFGETSVIRDWGRIGTNGRSMIETFDKPEMAEGALARLARVKRRRGYDDAGTQGGGQDRCRAGAWPSTDRERL